MIPCWTAQRASSERRLRPGALAEVVEVVLHRARGDVQDLPDLAVRATCGDQPEDLLLAGPEQRARRAELAPGGARVVAHQIAGERRADDGPATVYRDDGLAQLLAADALGEISGCPGA